jgi:ABC-2 type transport system ATP-binding protein
MQESGMTRTERGVVAVLEVVTKRFGPVVALDRVSLALEAGSIVALLGPNGAGKSTLSSLLLGLRRPDAGTVRVLGLDPRDHRGRAAVGAALQDMGFPQSLRVAEVVELVDRHFPRCRADVLEGFGLSRLLRRQTGALSTGQRRRLAVALAFLGDPSLVVLDEPTAGLDPEARRSVSGAIRDARRRGAAVLLTTHHLDEAEEVASRVVAIDRGRTVADGSVSEIKARAGRTRIRFRGSEVPPHMAASVEDGWVTMQTADAGETVARLVHAGVPLRDLEVRPLSLEEALAGIAGAAT